MKRWLLGLPLIGVLTVASGCSLSDSGYKPGELGNGGFYFSCSDTVSCSRYSDDAKKFPQSVSLGSSFSVRFVSNTSATDTHMNFDERAPDRGITITAVGEYLSKGPNGLVALKPGYASVISRDAAGQLVDFVSLRVARPDALVIYAADDVRDNPDRIDTVSLAKSDRRSFRAFAQEKKQLLAGTLAVDWRSSDPTIVDIESLADGKATIVARRAGSAKLFAVGGTFEQQIPVEVRP